MGRRKILLALGGVVAVSVLACAITVVVARSRTRPAADTSRTDYAHILRPSLSLPDTSSPAPEFQAWVANRFPQPDNKRPWLGNITDAQWFGNNVDAHSALMVRSSLPADRGAVVPAVGLCVLAKQFIEDNSTFGTRSVGIIGADGGLLVLGSLTTPCTIQPHLRARL
jgi:hypothetical protein